MTKAEKGKVAGRKTPATKPNKAATPKTKAGKTSKKPTVPKAAKKVKTTSTGDFPEEFPFWARLKISKNRTTLVIDEEIILDKKTKKTEEGFVHREATHTQKKDYEEIKPNPDESDPDPMYLKRPSKLPKRMFSPHNKQLNMPEELKKRYKANNDKKKK